MLLASYLVSLGKMKHHPKQLEVWAAWPLGSGCCGLRGLTPSLWGGGYWTALVSNWFARIKREFTV